MTTAIDKETNQKTTKDTKLFSPGPTPITQVSIDAFQASPLHHRSAEFTGILSKTLALLKPLFDEDYLIVFPSTGTGALEASITNFLKADDTVISIDGGKFGARWTEILSAYKINHHVHKFPWGKTPSLKELEVLLKKHKPKALYMQACETSTGTTYDVSPIANLIKSTSPETLLVVDGVTAVGAYKLSMKENSIDILIAGSQKAFGLPVGLSFLGFSKKAHLAAKSSNLPKYYFNVLKELKAHSKGTSVLSSPTQIWTALYEELKRTNFDKKFKLNIDLKNKVSTWTKENRLKLFSDNPSISLTAILLPPELSASKIQDSLIEKGYYIAKGQEDYADKLLRIGHMVNITEDEMDAFLIVLTKTLKEFGH